MNKRSVVDLFSGCGGLSYGFLMAGYNVALGLDNDSVSLKTFEANHPGAKIIADDISKVGGKDILNITGQKKMR